MHDLNSFFVLKYFIRVLRVPYSIVGKRLSAGIEKYFKEGHPRLLWYRRVLRMQWRQQVSATYLFPWAREQNIRRFDDLPAGDAQYTGEPTIRASSPLHLSAAALHFQVPRFQPEKKIRFRFRFFSKTPRAILDKWVYVQPFLGLPFEYQTFIFNSFFLLT